MKLVLIILFALFCLPIHSQSVITRGGDNSRTGDFQESTITVASLKAKGIRKLTTIPVIGDARGMESQPLILSGVKIADGTTHDVMVLPSMANVVRGVDAHTGAALWQTTLGTPIQGGSSIDMHLINDKWGVLSTGVIDPDSKIVYLVAWISPDGTPRNGVHWIYAINLIDGSLANPRVSLAGLKNGNQSYSATMRKQRSSLVMTNVNGIKTVFFAYGTVLETGNGASGAIIAYDIASNSVTAFQPMSQGLGAGIWMGGQGLSADSNGFLYGVTGNGSFNGVNDFGESIFKAQYFPPTSKIAGKISIISWWSPYSDAGRVGLNPVLSGPAAPVTNKLSGESAPSEEVSMPVGGSMKMPASTKVVISRDTRTGAAVPLIYPTNPTDPAWSDEDLGSGGCTLISNYGKLLCGGKDGLGYIVNSGYLGNTIPADFANAKANCAKIASPPVWMTSSPGPVDPCPQDPTTLNFMPYGKTRHLHMTPVQYWSPTDGLHVFVWGENSTLHDWKVSPTGSMTYVAESRETASVGSTNNPGGMPGGFCSLSSNAFKLGTSILWCSIPLGDANSQITNGRLIAYDPENLAKDSDGMHLVKLWDSQDWGLNYVFNKFMPPIIWNGEVILPNYNGGVDIYVQ